MYEVQLAQPSVVFHMSCSRLCFEGFFRIANIDISRQYGPTVISSCCCGNPALLAKLYKKNATATTASQQDE